MSSRPFSYQWLIFVFIMTFGHIYSLFSQEDIKDQEDDTLALENILYGPDMDYNLNIALFKASAEGHINQIRWLINKGADINAWTYDHVTALHFAAGNDNKEAVRVLLEYEPDLNVLSSYSESPLHIAVKRNNSEIAEMLVRAGADINIKDRFGATPLHYASAYGYFSIVDMLLYYEASIWLSDNEGTTPLMASVWAGHANIADLLLQKGADPSSKDRDGFTPFLIAAQNGDTLIMELLIKRFVNIYETNKYKYNALDLAIMANHKEAVEFLLKKGDKWTTDYNNEAINPYSVAVSYSRKDLADMLLKYKIPPAVHKGFDQTNVMTNAKINLHDFYTGINISLKAPLKNIGILTGIDFKPTYSRVLVKKSEDEFFQYFDKSYLLYAGAFKDFSLTDYPLKGNWKATLLVGSGYFFGNKYRGTNLYSEQKFKLIASAGIKYEKNNLLLKAEIEYFSTPFYNIGPLWLRLGTGYTFFRNNIKAPGKLIKWY